MNSELHLQLNCLSKQVSKRSEPDQIPVDRIPWQATMLMIVVNYGPMWVKYLLHKHSIAVSIQNINRMRTYHFDAFGLSRDIFILGCWPNCECIAQTYTMTKRARGKIPLHEQNPITSKISMRQTKCRLQSINPCRLCTIQDITTHSIYAESIESNALHIVIHVLYHFSKLSTRNIMCNFGRTSSANRLIRLFWKRR